MLLGLRDVLGVFGEEVGGGQGGDVEGKGEEGVGGGVFGGS